MKKWIPIAISIITITLLIATATAGGDPPTTITAKEIQLDTNKITTLKNNNFDNVIMSSIKTENGKTSFTLKKDINGKNIINKEIELETTKQIIDTNKLVCTKDINGNDTNNCHYEITYKTTPLTNQELIDQKEKKATETLEHIATILEKRAQANQPKTTTTIDIDYNLTLKNKK